MLMAHVKIARVKAYVLFDKLHISRDTGKHPMNRLPSTKRTFMAHVKIACSQIIYGTNVNVEINGHVQQRLGGVLCPCSDIFV
jgi:hypothetical protein